MTGPDRQGLSAPGHARLWAPHVTAPDGRAMAAAVPNPPTPRVASEEPVHVLGRDAQPARKLAVAADSSRSTLLEDSMSLQTETERGLRLSPCGVAGAGKEAIVDSPSLASSSRPPLPACVASWASSTALLQPMAPLATPPSLASREGCNTGATSSDERLNAGSSDAFAGSW
eukprot:CAMPEP_0176296130 /NCGR_PEP_ID=MMETSP0121_2-20121125/58038_1 /TAXON_ID=160619 /ORGANISM="Kryptoperidinium foliaceum, Strain CCMP 1326" /LENGTH=171 /DNA_ID=CAMNT_0017637259 /DNA_START=14 /DNA_END=527 /DNA_ORIENTATION=-